MAAEHGRTEAAATPREPLRARFPVIVILINVFLDLLSFGVVIPLLPFYALHLGATPFLIGLMLTSYSAAQFIFSPIWGRLSDRIGRRPIILGSLLGSTASFIILANAHTLPILFLSRIAAGVATANVATSQAYIADITPPAQRARGMGWVGAAIGFGFIIGPAIGGVLAPFGYAVPFYAAAALSFGDFLLGSFVLPESRRTGRRESSRPGWRQMPALLRRPELGLLFALAFLLSFAFANMEATLAIFTQARFGFGARQNGWLFAYVGLLTVVNQAGLVGPLVGWLGERRLVVIGMATMAVGMLTIPLAFVLATLLVGMAVMAFGSGVSNPSLASLVSRCSPAQYQGGVLGVMQALGSLARMTGPIWGGYVFGRFGPNYPFVSAAAFMSLAALVSLRLLRPPAVPCEEGETRPMGSA